MKVSRSKCDLCQSYSLFSKRVVINDQNKYSHQKSFYLNFCKCGFKWINLNNCKLDIIYNNNYFEKDVYIQGYDAERSYINKKSKEFLQKINDLNCNC